LQFLPGPYISHNLPNTDRIAVEANCNILASNRLAGACKTTHEDTVEGGEGENRSVSKKELHPSTAHISFSNCISIAVSGLGEEDNAVIPDLT
jgi:hypothetical protein